MNLPRAESGMTIGGLRAGIMHAKNIHKPERKDDRVDLARRPGPDFSSVTERYRQLDEDGFLKILTRKKKTDHLRGFQCVQTTVDKRKRIHWTTPRCQRL